MPTDPADPSPLTVDAHTREAKRAATARGRERSPQTLSEADRRHVAVWAADCVERVLVHFEIEAPESGQPRAAVARARAYARGELGTADEIRRRFTGGNAAKDVEGPAAIATARAAGQLSAVPHMGAHALGAAAYAVKAAGLASPDTDLAMTKEIDWQLAQLTPEVRTALGLLPPIGTDRAGPLGKGLLASGVMGEAIVRLQRGIAEPGGPSGAASAAGR